MQSRDFKPNQKNIEEKRKKKIGKKESATFERIFTRNQALMSLVN